MGKIVEFRKSRSESKYNKLTIYTHYDHTLFSSAFSMNRPIAKELIGIPSDLRSMNIERTFVHLLDAMPPEPLIKDIDVLFNPAYKIDVISILVSIYKKRPFSLIWSGEFKDNKMCYSESGYKDHASFDPADYDIICII